MDSFTSKRSDRVIAAAFALLLQLGFVALLVQAMRPTATPEKLVQELIFVLPRLVAPKEQPVPTTIDARGPPRPIVEAPAPPSPITLPPAASSATTAPSSNLSGVGQSIFGCAPENYANLTSQQRAHCPPPGEGYAIQQVPDLMHPPDGHVKDEAHWANALTHEQSPILLPGGSKDGKMFTIIGIDDSGKASGLLAGSADPESWPTYDVTTPAPGDFYKIEQAYDAWNKARRVKSAMHENPPAPAP